MPYRPTNMSPDNVAIVRGEDIIFNCLIDKYDTVTKAELILYDMNNKNNIAYIKMNMDEEIYSSGLSCDEKNTSELPFVAKDYEVPIFTIGVLNTSSFLQEVSSVSYCLILSNENIYENFVLEGNILDTDLIPESTTAQFYIAPSPLLKNDKSQKIVNKMNKAFDFTMVNSYYFQNNKIKNLDNKNNTIYLEYSIPEVKIDSWLKLETIVGLFSISEIDFTNRKITVKESLESFDTIEGTVVSIYNEYNILSVEKSILDESMIDYERQLLSNFRNNPFPENIVFKPQVYYKEIGEKTNKYYYMMGLYDKNNTAIELNDEKLQEINQYSYFFSKNKVNYAGSNLGKVVKFNGKEWRPQNHGYVAPQYCFNIGFSERTDTSSPNYLNIDGYEHIFIEIPTIASDISNQNSYFQIKSNNIESPERAFTLIDKKEVTIQQENNSYRSKIFSGSLSGDQNTIEYSQWILKKDGVIIDKSPKAYAKIENYQYNLFEDFDLTSKKPMYDLILKVHDKRNIDWSAEEKTLKAYFSYETEILEAIVENKYVKVMMPTALSNQSDLKGYVVNRYEISENEELICQQSLGFFEGHPKFIKDYGAGQCKHYRYEVVGIGYRAVYKTNTINTFDWYEINLFGTKSYYTNTDKGKYTIDEDNLWTFRLDANANQITFNATNTPIDASGSRFPKITASNKNYLSGSGSMYLGTLDNDDMYYTRDNDAELLRFSEFANNGAVKFLKLKNGMVIPVSITLKSSSNLDNLNGNPTKINFDWVQVDDLNSTLTKEATI